MLGSVRLTQLSWRKLSAREQVTCWHDIMDDQKFSVRRFVSPPAREALSVLTSCRFRSPSRAPLTITSRGIKCPFQAREMCRRFPAALPPGGRPGVASRRTNRTDRLCASTVGLPRPLGDPFYPPVYAAAECCGAPPRIHGSAFRQVGRAADDFRRSPHLRFPRRHPAPIHQHDLPGGPHPVSPLRFAFL